MFPRKTGINTQTIRVRIIFGVVKITVHRIDYRTRTARGILTDQLNFIDKNLCVKPMLPVMLIGSAHTKSCWIVLGRQEGKLSNNDYNGNIFYRSE
jgi:hypothetical protein